MTVEIRYKCRCLTEEVTLQALERRETEDIGNWMNLVLTPSIYLDHRARSPTCEAVEMEYAKVYLPPDGGPIGSAFKPN